MTTVADPIYLDHNATTPVHPEVLEAMLPFLHEHFGNASSSHVYGRRTREAVEAARGQVAALIGAAPGEIVFTSGGIEANNLAIQGMARRHGKPGRIVTSCIEHPATEGPCTLLEGQGWEVHRLAVDAQGQVRFDEARAALQPGTALLTLIHAHNETGVVQPVAEVGRMAHEAGALVHTDAAQSAGKIPVDVDALGVDLLSLVGHKLYGPKGIGALYVSRGTPLAPLFPGSPGDLRPGTLNTPSIVGLGAACALAARELEAERTRIEAMRDELLDRLRAAIPGIVLFGHPAERLPNTLYVGFPGATGEALLDATPDVAASTGSACHSGQHHASAVLMAMGIGPEPASGAVRLSLGRQVAAVQIPEVAARLVLGWQAASAHRAT